MTLLGADPDGLDQLAALIDRSMARIDHAQRDIGRHLASAAWRGADADRMRSEWQGRGAPAVQGVRAMLAGCTSDLRSQAAAQRHASGADGGVNAGGVLGGGGGGGSWGGGEGGTAVAPRGDDSSKRWDRPSEAIWNRDTQWARDDDLGPRPDVDRHRAGDSLLDDLGISAEWKGFDESFGWGNPDWSLEKGPWSAFAGVVASAGAGVDLNKDGLRGEASGRAGAVIEAQGGISGEYGDLQGRAAVEAVVDADGGLTVDGKGVAANVGAHALAGSTAGGSWSSPEVAGVEVGADASVNYGLGFDANTDLMFTADRVKLKFKLGATFGLGFSGGASIDIQPKEVFESIEDHLGDIQNLFG